MSMYAVNASIPKTLVQYICRTYAYTCENTQKAECPCKRQRGISSDTDENDIVSQDRLVVEFPGHTVHQNYAHLVLEFRG